MDIRDRKDFMNSLIIDYIKEREINKVWQRENSSGYSIAIGKLQGACMALSLDYTETEDKITLFTASKKKIITVINKNDYI